MNTDEEPRLRTSYNARVPLLMVISDELATLLRSLLSALPRIDTVTARPKTVDRFVDKAFRLDDLTGVRKYSNPLDEIQDQIGLRVVVHYKSDVERVRVAVLREFTEIEDLPKEQPRPDMFGYEAHHFICMIPLDMRQKYSPPIEFFELQISTLFQHAWAEANHELGHKPTTPLTYDQRRQAAWAASQAWGADEIFQSLWRQFQAAVPPEGTPAGPESAKNM